MIMKARAGQAMVEIIIAFAVATIAVLGLVAVATKSLSNAGAAKRAAQATAYAMEGMEWVTGQRYTVSWTEFFGKTGTWCLNDLGAAVTWSGLPSGSCGTGVIGTTEYTRYMELMAVSGIESNVTVTVSWLEGSRQAFERQTSRFTSY